MLRCISFVILLSVSISCWAKPTTKEEAMSRIPEDSEKLKASFMAKHQDMIAATKEAIERRTTKGDHEPVECGDVILEDRVLTKNLNCDCRVRAALTIIEASLDMNGFTVSCQEPFNSCVMLFGNSPRIFSSRAGATLSQCNTGILTMDSTNSSVEGFSIVAPTSDAIVSFADGMTIKDVFIENAGSRGIFTISDDLVIQRAHVLGGSDCYFLFGNNHQVFDSVGKDCRMNGFFVNGFNPLGTFVAKNNLLQDCALVGIFLFNTQSVLEDNRIVDIGNTGMMTITSGCSECSSQINNNVIKGTGASGIFAIGNYDVGYNTISNVGGDGIFLGSNSGKTIRRNRIFGCTEAGGDGIDASGTELVITRNVVKQCERGVVVVAGSNNNLIERNAVAESTTDADLFDGNFECAENTWINNFGRGNQKCSDGRTSFKSTSRRKKIP